MPLYIAKLPYISLYIYQLCRFIMQRLKKYPQNAVQFCIKEEIEWVVIYFICCLVEERWHKSLKEVRLFELQVWFDVWVLGNKSRQQTDLYRNLTGAQKILSSKWALYKVFKIDIVSFETDIIIKWVPQVWIKVVWLCLTQREMKRKTTYSKYISSAPRFSQQNYQSSSWCHSKASVLRLWLTLWVRMKVNSLQTRTQQNHCWPHAIRGAWGPQRNQPLPKTA